MLTVNKADNARTYYSLPPKNKKLIVLAKVRTLQQNLLKSFKFTQLYFIYAVSGTSILSFQATAQYFIGRFY